MRLFLKHLFIFLTAILLAQAAPFSRGGHTNSSTVLSIVQPNTPQIPAVHTSMQMVQRVDVIYATTLSIPNVSTYLTALPTRFPTVLPTTTSGTSSMNATTTEDEQAGPTEDCLSLERRSPLAPWLSPRALRKGGKGGSDIDHPDCRGSGKTTRKISPKVIAAILMGAIFGLAILGAAAAFVYAALSPDQQRTGRQGGKASSDQGGMELTGIQADEPQRAAQGSDRVVHTDRS
ncbi:hypothetical protein DL771_007375 [Monosporascus sp. 5C6A]|nr:hypothetical protein DL771_007375 [Monosporascus sp. 5C6A]